MNATKSFANKSLHSSNLSLEAACRPAIEALESRTLLSGTPWYGSVLDEGDAAMRADIARSTYGVDGSGVKIGIISDSFDRLNGYATDIATGDLSAGVQILAEGAPGGTDEGRAMAQIIHDVAPGAQILFHTYEGSASDDQDLADAIHALANAGANVIVDDITEPGEPMFQDGKSAQAVDDVVAQGVAYFSSAGNHGGLAYQSVWHDSGLQLDPLGDNHWYNAFAFNPTLQGADKLYQSITIPVGQTIHLALQWADPFYSVTGNAGTQSDLDLWLFDSSGTVRIDSANDNLFQTGDPAESLVWTNDTVDTLFDLAITLADGPAPSLLKYVIFQSPDGVMINDPNWQPTATLYGHANADGAMAVGASAWDSPLTIESYSSLGRTPILFDPSGNSYSSPVLRPKPEISGPDGVSTTVPGFEFFDGTSAAAPNIAAVAALMLQANPYATPLEIYSALDQTAEAMNEPSVTVDTEGNWNAANGNGFVQADKAVKLITEGSISGYVFNDANHNGQIDQGELAMDNWTVFIDDNNNGALDAGEASFTTSADGAYSFSGLQAGAYIVREVPTGSYISTTSASGWSVDLASGEHRTDINFGEHLPTGQITGVKWNDLNGNGVRDSAEPLLSGWTVYLDLNNNGQLDAGEPTSATVADGSYSFANLAPGSYIVREILQSGWAVTKPSTDVWNVTIAWDTVGGKDFGSVQPARFSGRVFYDRNANRMIDAGETMPWSVNVYIDANNNGVRDAGEVSAATDASGNFSLSVLPGAYHIRVSGYASGWVFTYPSSSGVFNLSLMAGQVVSGVAFGMSNYATVTGVVFFDRNANRIYNSGETALWVLTVYDDANNNGRWDSGETGVSTDSKGQFSISVPAGIHRLRLGGVKSGWYYTYPFSSGVFTLALSEGQTISGVAFGLTSYASITGIVFFDRNGNRVWNTGEATLAGWRVFLDANNNGRWDSGEASVLTDQNGKYVFKDLKPGSYVIRLLLPSNYKTTSPASNVFTYDVLALLTYTFKFGVKGA